MDKKTYHNIRRIREMNDLTRDFVAAELKMSTSGYGKIERGEIDLTLSKLFKISAIFGISVTDLLYFDVTDIFQNRAEKGSSNNTALERQTISNKLRIFDLETENLILKKEKSF
jgi:transcriptional regulator with XRE-family HTH domain